MADKRTAQSRNRKIGNGRPSLDRVIHEEARLGILTSLAANPNGILFSDLKHLVDLTDGNLNRHLKVLVDAKLIKATKKNRGRNSQTTYRITKRGLQEFADYLNQLESVLRKANAAASAAMKTAPSKLALR